MERKKWLPRTFSESLTREIERLFEDFFGPIEFEEAKGKHSFFPAMDIAEDDQNLIIKVDIPGMTQKDVSVEIHDNVLIIKGEKKVEDEIKEKNFHVSERRYGSFIRQITLPDYLQPEKTKAKIKDGVLTITIPKKEEENLKKISVSVEE